MRIAFELPPDVIENIRREARAAVRAEVDALRAELEALRAERAAPPAPRELRFMRRRAFAERVGIGLTKLDQLIAAGMPCVGAGRSRRVDVHAADEWMRTHLHARD